MQINLTDQANRAYDAQLDAANEQLDKKAQNLKTRGDVQKVAQDFESLFLEIVLRSMRNTVVKSGFIDGGNAEDIYRSMLDSEYSKQMAGQNTTGLAHAIESQLLKTMNIPPQAADRIKAGLGQKAYNMGPK